MEDGRKPLSGPTAKRVGPASHAPMSPATP